MITLEVDRLPNIYEDTKGKDICIEIDKWSDKKSNSQNNYYRQLVGEIARVLHASTTEVHNWLLSEYGQIDYEMGKIALDDKIDWRRLEIHLKPTSEYTFEDDRMMHKYFWVRGTHTYNTKEMSQLIDGTVLEARELGIETDTPKELERMKQLWKAL